MPCDCCKTGRCCNGGNCSAGTKSKCATEGGSFTDQASIRGNPCDNKACNDPAGRSFCDLRDPCACADAGRLPNEWETCNCHLEGNACPALLCSTCSIVNGVGNCVSTCPSPRECCEGTCCPIHQTCTSNQCVNKCETGKTFCQGSGSSFTCCTSTQKCCGPVDGCKPRSATSANVTVIIDLSQDKWFDTGITVPSNSTVTITATGFREGGNAFFGTGAYPNGVMDEYCNLFSECKVTNVCLLRLIGRVGGTTFDVGASYSGKPGSGTLQLRANNTCVSDITGSYEARVQYVTDDPCPNYTPSSVGEPIVYAAGPIPGGPGTELKLLLKLGGIVASPTCSCNARAAQMDAWGEWECLTRLPEICGWLREEAEKRDLWFFAPAGMALISAAIALSALKRPFRGNSK